jgi:hypothetical protein
MFRHADSFAGQGETRGLSPSLPRCTQPCDVVLYATRQQPAVAVQFVVAGRRSRREEEEEKFFSHWKNGLKKRKCGARRFSRGRVWCRWEPRRPASCSHDCSNIDKVPLTSVSLGKEEDEGGESLIQDFRNSSTGPRGATEGRHYGS